MLSSALRHCGKDLASSVILRDLIRSMVIKTPVVDRNKVSWNLDVVLQYLLRPPFEPIDRASSLNLLRKTLFLVALATSKRVSELHGLANKVGYMNGDAVVSYQQTFVAKTENSLRKLPRRIVIKNLELLAGQEPDGFNCPVRALNIYLAKLEDAPNRASSLFCALRSPHKPLSKNGVSMHLRMSIKEAHANLPEHMYPVCKVKSQEVRAVALSMRYNLNWNVLDLLYSATWRCDSMFAMHYLKEVEVDYGHCKAIGPFVAAGAVIM